MRRRALLDANVLWSAQQRNLLLQFAVQETISVHWTAGIIEEWLRNVEPPLRARLEERTLPLMRRHFPDAVVEGVDEERDTGRTDVKDRHVARAALAVAPCAIVTWDLADFDREHLEREGVQVLSPDALLAELFDAGPELVFAVVREAQANLTKSAPSWDDYLDLLAGRHGLTAFVARLKAFEQSLPRGIEETDAINVLSGREMESTSIAQPDPSKRK